MDNMEPHKNTLKKIVIVFLIIAIICIVIILYARYIGTKGINTNEIKLVETKLTDEFKGFKIVHISDIQYGKTTFKTELDELVKKVNLTKPDIVVITGDLINNECDLTEEDKNILIAFLNKINANIKKYAVSGENDMLFSDFDTILTQGGFINLDNNYDTIYNGKLNYILISGIGNNYHENSLINTTNYLNENENQPIYKILLIHKPDTIDQLTESFDLVLSGHSLNGLVNIPLIGPLYLSDGSKKYYNNFYQINDTKLYITNGIGTNKYSFRLFNKPSFNFYRITNKQ